MARRRWGLLIGMGLVGAAVATELRKPRGERTWNGRIGGIVPYDLRRPTFDRMQRAWWSPEESRIISESPFGVGWTLNFGRVAKLVGGDRGGFEPQGV